MSEGKHPLEGYWLVRGAKRDAECNPFRSVMELSLEDAIRVGADENKKFKDGFQKYLDFRGEVESWVRENASNKEIDINNPNPVYFTLQPAPFLNAPPEGHLQINIPAEQIPVEAFSLTYADSFENYKKLQGKPSEWTPESTACEVFNAEEVGNKLKTQGFPADLTKYKDSSYIEVQLWNRDLPALENAKQKIRESDTRVITLEPQNTLSKALDDFLNEGWQAKQSTVDKMANSSAVTPEQKEAIEENHPNLRKNTSSVVNAKG